MNISTRTIVLSLSFCFACSLKAQNDFSQFFSSQTLFNPANTGRFNKSYKIVTSFRSEKNATAVFNKGLFDCETKLLTGLLPENDCFAVGVTGLSEKSLAEGITNSYLSLSFAYQKGLNETGDQHIGLGFQTTLSTKKIEKPQYIFEDQLYSWIQSGFTNIDIYQITNVNITYADLNVGLIYQGKINPRNYISLGGAVFHATKPQKFFQGGELVLKRHYRADLCWQRKINDKKYLTSFFLFSTQEKKRNYLAGFLVNSNITNRFSSLKMGAAFKRSFTNDNFIVPSAGVAFWDMSIHFSYDINISPKNTYNRGASEITLIYNHAKSKEKLWENRFITF